MTNRERFLRTLKGEKIGGQVPTFELVFFLTMEAFGKVHPSHRSYGQWNQMSHSEKSAQIKDMAGLYIATAERYGHSGIFVHPNPGDFEHIRWLLEEIREKSGDEYFLMMHGDPTWAMPDGDNMVEFSAKMYEEPEVLNEASARRLEESLTLAAKLPKGLLDGFALCSDYCFNVNPFFTPEFFDQLIVPYLKGAIDGYRELGYCTIKHTDGNIMPILRQMADCRPDGIHSLDPQGGVEIGEVRRIIGEDICLIGNVNCGLLQTGTEEDCEADVRRSLREGMERGRGYIFSTSNCAYTGLPLERYELMNRLWRELGNYDK
ncbi:MAG: uroporphyrinogen decarboxylase family protein [Oscillospiraceae bacterium]